MLGGAGTMFSSGHDMGSPVAVAERARPRPAPDHGDQRRHPAGAEKLMLQEWHHFFEDTRRWRNLRKITIAEVKGPVFSAGLMLMWACDLIVAAEGTMFADVVGHPARDVRRRVLRPPLGVRPPQGEGAACSRATRCRCDEAHALGMVSKVFPLDELEAPHRRVRPAHRPGPDHGGPPDQGVGQPERRHHGLPQRPAGVLHAARAEPRPLGAGPRQRVPRGPSQDGVPDWRSAPPVVPASKTEP